MGWRQPPEFLGFASRDQLKKLHLAFRRDVLREDTPWDGASAVPAGGFVTRSRAASGISLPASRPAREVLTVRGQLFRWFSGAGNTRGDAHDPRPGWRSIGSNAPDCLPKHGLVQSLGDQLSPWQEPRWDAERRAPPQGAPRARKARVVTTRLSAFRFPFVCSLGRAHGNPGHSASGEAVSNMVGQTARTRTKIAPRERDRLRSPLPACGRPTLAARATARFWSRRSAERVGGGEVAIASASEAIRVRGPLRDSERFQSSASVTDDDRHSGSSTVPSSRPSPRTAGSRSRGNATQNGRESGRNAAAIDVQTPAACFRLAAGARGFARRVRERSQHAWRRRADDAARTGNRTDPGARHRDRGAAGGRLESLSRSDRGRGQPAHRHDRAHQWLDRWAPGADADDHAARCRRRGAAHGRRAGRAAAVARRRDQAGTRAQCAAARQDRGDRRACDRTGGACRARSVRRAYIAGAGAIVPAGKPVDRAVQHRERARRPGGCRVGCAAGAAKVLVRRRGGVVRRAVQRPRRGRRRRSTLWLSHLRQPDARRHANQARCRSVRHTADDAVRRHAEIRPGCAEFRRRARSVAAGRCDARQWQARAQRAVARNRRDHDHAVVRQAAEGDISLRPGRARAELYRQRRCDARSRAASGRQAQRHGARCRSRAGCARCDRSAAARRHQKFPAGLSVRGEIADAGQDRLERGFADARRHHARTRCPAIWISIRAAGRSIIFSCTRRA